ncbi:MAG TPA: polysaccharide biosynthesis tyrosine autokinase, partial [Nitrospiraceae bacterium]|nr:polysaccharide biosynthesis tyrosine autokinase [Nitrospiraceae bacterium]
ELVRISVEHTQPAIAAAAANAVAESLVDMSLKARRSRATDTRRFIEQQLALAAQKLRASESAVVVFKNSYGDISLAEETSLNLQRLAQLGTQRVEARLPRQEVQALVATLQNQLATLQIELSGLRRQFTSSHPSVVSTEAKIAETERRLRAEMAHTRQTEQSRERAITTAIDQYEAQLRRVPTREADLARLTRNTKEAEEIYLLLSTKYQQALIAEASIGSAIRVVDVAKVPEAPVKPRALKTTLLGLVFGLALGMAGAFLTEQLDDTVKSAEDVERVLGAPVLGAIPVMKAGKHAGNGRGSHAPLLLRQVDGESPQAEAFRVLRTHVLSSIPGAEQRCLLVTSPWDREGKSTVAANLALAFARTDRRVWLLDCNLRRSGLSDLFPEASSSGLAKYLTGQATLDEVIRVANEPRLWFGASGPRASNTAELLGSQSMARLMNEARTRADVVLLDTPAILTAADAEVAGGYVDGVILVVKLAKTERRALAQVRQRLEHLGVRVVGAVLNFVPTGRGYHGANFHLY